MATDQRTEPKPFAADDPKRVITVRIHKSTYDALKRLAYVQQTSLNLLCVEALRQTLNEAADNQSEESNGD